jgi:hypothetical protein
VTVSPRFKNRGHPPLHRNDALRTIWCHTFQVTGITVYAEIYDNDMMCHSHHHQAV